MIQSAPRPPGSSVFNPFLYATVGDDPNGMSLTVLSAFARQDVDPWEEAADLSELPGETAIQRITSRLETIPGAPSLADRTAIARRLLTLLPRPRITSGLHARLIARIPARVRSVGRSELCLVMIYLALMCAGEWIFAASMQPAAPTRIAAQEPAH